MLVGDAPIEEIAAASAKAAELDLGRFADDPVFQFVAKMLVELPLLARMPATETDRAELIREVDVTAPQSVSALLSSINAVIEQHTFETGRSSDIGLMAQSALIETLSSQLR